MEDSISIKNARVNNLKHLSVNIPRNRLVVITGLSGSGKSSLAFDTLFAEGQRRYVESLSAYARQFLGKMSKPEVDSIDGLSPAIAIEQKALNRNPRSTVGTSTEIYEYLRLLYARIGRTYSPVSGREVLRDSVSRVCETLFREADGQKIILTTTIQPCEEPTAQRLHVLESMGFSRIYLPSAGEVLRIGEALRSPLMETITDYELLIDRLRLDTHSNESFSRLFDSVQSAYHEGESACLAHLEDGRTLMFSNRFECDGLQFEKPNENFFSFNSPYGACPTCQGFGNIVGISEDLVVPNPKLSVYEDAIALWRGERMKEFKLDFIRQAEKLRFPIHKSYRDLSPEQKELLWKGKGSYRGIQEAVEWVQDQQQKIQYRVMLSRYRGKTACPDCHGSRLRKDAGYVKIGGKSVSDLVCLPIDQLSEFFTQLVLDDSDTTIAKRLLHEIQMRINYLLDVGLGYLTLNRLSGSLSGGEAQRIRLATSLGSTLVGSMYILDEPSVGLHSRDTQRLIRVLQRLRDLGNTVIVVEHDEEIIRAADHVIDIGPMAGQYGGELVFEGTQKEMGKAKMSLTADYICGRKSIPMPEKRRTSKHFIELTGACENNLRDVNIKIPLGLLTVVSGVSGSGKTTLIRQTLYPALKRHFDGYGESIGKHEALRGDLHRIGHVELVDQNPIGRSTRSNPATYVKAYDDIRELYADQALAKTRHYKPGFFSFNTEGGRCETCQGEGIIRVPMQFMADVLLTCEECQGTRFKEETLEVRYRGKNIDDLLRMSIGEALEFFRGDIESPKVRRVLAKLQPLEDVGLGYLQMGQASTTLSGGEAQRVKLAYFLTKGVSDTPTLFIFDEPTTGLHFHDIQQLKAAFDALIEKGHTIVVIEHHPDLIRAADHVIDLGPEGGHYGGQILFSGSPVDLPHCKKSITGQFLKFPKPHKKV